jgi:ammonium transporter Rh
VNAELSSVVDALKYFRAIDVMVMLLLGFGFLMVFVRGYGRSAITATYLLVSVTIPLYLLKDSLGIFGAVHSDIDRLILAEFAAASLLICAGAVLGRLRMYQYVVLGLLFVPCYALNEWLLTDNGLGLVKKGAFVDTGGSILIHAFGAFFGLGVVIIMTTRKEYEVPVESDATSDRFSLIGSMALWVFWPSFCAALVPVAAIPATAANVILALCGATLATYVASVTLRKGKLSAADIANATLAGGVAIGSTCDVVSPGVAFVIGLLAGVLSTVGFALIQARFQGLIKKIDTCGVMYLHGLPGLWGGIAAVFVVSGIDQAAQIEGIVIAMALAVVTGLVAGGVVALTGRRTKPYDDAREFIVEDIVEGTQRAIAVDAAVLPTEVALP